MVLMVRPKSKASGLQTIRGLQTSVNDDLIGKFLEQVQATPDKPAIITSELTLTYSQLYTEVLSWHAKLDPYLKTRVIICLNRSPRLISVLLALQWLNITYIPIDRTQPLERIRAIIEDSQAEAILFDAEDSIYNSLDCLKLNLSKLENSVVPSKNYSLPCAQKNASLAYIIYTSGSTGKPKGVAISRLALNNCLQSFAGYFLNEDQGLLLAITTIAFDIAALELFLPLWQGKTIFLTSQEEHKDLASLLKILNDYPITHLQATPAMWKLLANENWRGKSSLKALCGGEALTPSLAKILLSEVAELWNMYGPTEATIWCSLKQIRIDEPITIGQPIANTEMVVMDSNFKILPPYVKGELYIAGLCLAEGYVNNPLLTRERFISNKQAFASRFFRVGDLACSTPEGEFIIFGRKDNQIKLHGYRIELEEIEAHIQTISGVKESAVKLYNEQLIAYLSTSNLNQISEEELKLRLAKKLPEYMIPSRIIFLDKLPLSVSGKIARDALPPPVSSNVSEREERELTVLQLALIPIWSETLAVPSLNIHQNFYELGGDSLTAARIALKISKQFDKKLNAQDLYRAPTIALLAELIESLPDYVSFDKNKKAINTKKSWFPLDDFQLTLWISRFHAPKLKKFNNIARQRIQGKLNIKALDLALQLIVQKHESLSFSISKFYPAQRQANYSLHWIETSLLDYDDEEAEAYLKKSFENLFHQKLWGRHAPMARAKLFYLREAKIELQISLSHFISDESSIAIFFQELENAYHFFTDYLVLKAKELSFPFRSYLVQQNEIAAKYAADDAEFWSHYLQDADYYYFSKKYIAKNLKGSTCLSSYFEISETILIGLRKYCQKNQVSLNNVLCAAIALTLKSCATAKSLPAKLFMNAVRSTREDADYDDVIGCFLRLHTFKVDFTEDNSLLNLTKQIQQTNLELLEHQRASSLIKIAAVKKKSWLQKFFINLFSKLFSKFSTFINLNPILINAFISLAFAKPRKGFMVNVNIFSTFFSGTESFKETLFNLPKQSIPPQPYPFGFVNNVLEICFHRNENKPYVAITSNLTSDFRQQIGKTLLDIIQKELN